MRTIKFLLQKEFRQIFRNKMLLPSLFMMPTIQLLIMPLAANFEVKNINLSVIDKDHSSYSQKMVSKIISSGYFRLIETPNSYQESLPAVENESVDVVLEIPAEFERNIIRESESEVFIAINAINGMKATIGGVYINQIIQLFNQDVRIELIEPARFSPQPQIDIQYTNWFNPFLNYSFYMVPGILATLVTMIGGYMCALNIVKEKEIGTIEQINVSPIKKHEFIIGKLIPFLCIGTFVFTVGLFGVARFVYGIIPLGSIALMYSFLVLYLVSILGFGLLISTFVDTQQQAMTVAFFFIMIFMLLGGVFTLLDSMPMWAKVIAALNPVRYFVEVMRMIVLKGSGFWDIKYHFLIVFCFGIFLNGWAIINYKKTS